MEDFYDIDKLVKDIDFSLYGYVDCGNGLMLTNKEIEVLKRYNINYKKCSSLKEIVYLIENLLADDIIDDVTALEDISCSIAERDYYLNTNK